MVLEIVAVFGRLVVRLDGTLMTTVKTCDAAPAASVVRVAVSVPLAPTAVESVRAQPDGIVMEFNVVPAGNTSLNVKPCASLGPLVLVTVIV